MEEAATRFVELALRSSNLSLGYTPPIFDVRDQDVDAGIDFTVAGICGPILTPLQCSDIATEVIQTDPVAARVLCESGGVQTRNAASSGFIASACKNSGYSTSREMDAVIKAVNSNNVVVSGAMGGVHSTPANYCAGLQRPVWKSILFWVIAMIPVLLILGLYLYSSNVPKHFLRSRETGSLPQATTFKPKSS